MSRRLRGVVVLCAALAMGALAVAAASAWMRNRVANELARSRQAPATRVVIATRDLPRGAAVLPEDVALAPMAPGTPLAGTLQRVEQAVGRVARVRLYAGEPLIEPKLAAGGARAGIEAAIPAGLRAITVKVDEVVGLAGFALPGCKVDVVAVVKPPRSEDAVAKLVLQNIEVLAADQGFESADGKPHQSSAITLLVTPRDSERLALAVVLGKIQLVMRAAGDESFAQTSGLDSSALLSREAVAPVVLAPPPAPKVAVVSRQRRPPKPPGDEVELIENDHRQRFDLAPSGRAERRGTAR